MQKFQDAHLSGSLIASSDGRLLLIRDTARGDYVYLSAGDIEKLLIFTQNEGN